MAGTYAGLVNSAVGAKLAAQLGLPRPAKLRRYAVGRSPSSTARCSWAAWGDAPVAVRVRDLLKREGDRHRRPRWRRRAGGAVVADLTEARGPRRPRVAARPLAPALKGLRSSGRVIVVGRDPRSANGFAQAATRRALEGITRSIGKELRAGATANLVLVG